jgi:hypothetical protein
MRRQARLGAGAVILVSVLAVAPGSAAASISADTTVSDVNKASKKLDRALKAYLTVNISSPPSDPAAWTDFFARGEKLVRALDRAFRDWSSKLDAAVRDGNRPPGYKRVKAYRDALRPWIEDQEEQLRLSRGCFSASSGFADVEAARSCYAQFLAENGARWQSHADRVNEFIR